MPIPNPSSDGMWKSAVQGHSRGRAEHGAGGSYTLAQDDVRNSPPIQAVPSGDDGSPGR